MTLQRKSPGAANTQAPKHNQIWKAQSKHGPNPIFPTPDELWEAAEEYCERVDANPLQEEKGFAFQGKVTKETFSKMRAMTVDGLCIFLDIDALVPNLWLIYHKSLREIIPEVHSKSLPVRNTLLRINTIMLPWKGESRSR